MAGRSLLLLAPQPPDASEKRVPSHPCGCLASIQTVAPGDHIWDQDSSTLRAESVHCLQPVLPPPRPVPAHAPIQLRSEHHTCTTPSCPGPSHLMAPPGPSSLPAPCGTRTVELERSWGSTHQADAAPITFLAAVGPALRVPRHPPPVQPHLSQQTASHPHSQPTLLLCTLSCWPCSCSRRKRTPTGLGTAGAACTWGPAGPVLPPAPCMKHPPSRGPAWPPAHGRHCTSPASPAA